VASEQIGAVFFRSGARAARTATKKIAGEEEGLGKEEKRKSMKTEKMEGAEAGEGVALDMGLEAMRLEDGDKDKIEDCKRRVMMLEACSMDNSSERESQEIGEESRKKKVDLKKKMKLEAEIKTFCQVTVGKTSVKKKKGSKGKAI
jgi:uncharacterized protein with von Willebrand factor type A (vWA) domain